MHVNHLSSAAALVVVLLTSPVGAFRHDGKSHNHPNRRQLPRQVDPDDQYGGGEGGQQSPSATSPQVFPIPTSPPPAGTMSTTLAVSNSPVNPIYTVAAAAVANGAKAAGWSYVFPTTMIQVPVATLCPGGGTGGPPLFTMAPASNISVTTETDNGTVTDYVPLQINATATLPGGKTTVFLSTSSTPIVRRRKKTTSSTSASAVAASASASASASNDMARIVLGPSGGCQTIYSPLTTQLCSTTVNPGGGMLPVQITDCDQWVTFSSERLSGECSTKMVGSDESNRDASEETGVVSADDEEATTSPSASAATFTDPMVFYAAHWYDLVVASEAASPLPASTSAAVAAATAVTSPSAPIPTSVRVENCLPFTTEPRCVTSSESWSVTSKTRTTTENKLVDFEGLAIITSGTVSTTTTISLSTTIIMTSVITDSTIVRSRIGGSTSIPATTEEAEEEVDSTVTIAMSKPTTKTWFVEAVSRTPSTESILSETIATDKSLDPTSMERDDHPETTTTVVVNRTMTTTLQVTETKTLPSVPDTTTAVPAAVETETPDT